MPKILGSLLGMDDSEILPRRLSATGCRLAGAQLATNVAALKKDKKTKLPADIEEHVAGVATATAALQATKDDSPSMFEIDNGADTTISGFADVLGGIVRCYARPDVVSVTAAESERAAAAGRLLGALGLESTGFLRRSYRLQYDTMQLLVAALAQPKNKADVTALGLTVEAQRVVKWTALYGRRLGITQAVEADVSQQSINAWHSAWAALSIGVRAKYRESSNAHDVLMRQELLSPYDTQAQAERDALNQADAKRSAADAKATSAATPPKPSTTT